MTTLKKQDSPRSALLKPIQIGPLQLRNRVVMAPMTRCRAGVERMPNAMMAQYYRQRASAGLIISEATIISDEARGWLHTPGIENDAQAEAWKLIVDEVHKAGGTIFIQLWHTGRASHSSFHKDDSLPVAPSPIKHRGEYIHTPAGKQDYETPRELRIEEISRIVEDFRLAAERGKRAGFDGVEIHAANGYLIDTFLQSHTNLRTDAYGGSLENRFRFLKEVTESVIGVFGTDRVGVRLGPNTDYNDMGAPDYREAFLYFAKQLDAFGLAYLHIIDGITFGSHGLGAAVTLQEIREVYTGTLMGNCGYEQTSAAETLKKGHADLIAFGRLYISNPDLVERFTHNWPLASKPESNVWYAFGKEGYTDFPPYQGV